MKKQVLSLFGCVVVGLALTVGNTACDKQGNAEITKSGNTKITPANVAKMSKGMQRAQVVALFGEPTKSGDVENDVVFKKQRVTYVEGKESLAITYKNDEVEEFSSTVGTTTSTSDSNANGTTTTTSSTSTKSDGN